MDITRRKFFFFGLAAGVTLLLPNMDVRVSKKELYELYGLYGGSAGAGKSELLSHYWGIPYHQNDGTIGTWLGISRN